MSFLAPKCTPTTGDTNTPANRSRMLERGLRDLAQATMLLTNDLYRLEQQERDARARLEDVHTLLWRWIKKAKCDWVTPPQNSDGFAADRAAHEQLHEAIFLLAETLGYDNNDVCDYANIELELQNRGLV